MKKFIILCLALCAALSLQAQELPYSKYLGFSKEEFRENKFKYNERTNTWYLHRVNGLNVTFNVLAILADASEDIRPAMNDYTILVQMGEEEQAASIVYGYYKAEFNSMIDAFIIRSEYDDFAEVQAGLSMGLIRTTDWRNKEAFYVYKYMYTPQSE